MSRLDELIAEFCPNGVEYLSIGSMINRSKERGKDAPNIKQVYVVSNSKGMVKAEDYRENTLHSEDTSNYTVIRKNMVAYNPSRLNIGSIAVLKYDEAGLVSPMYVVFSIDESKIECDYFEYLIKSALVASKIDALKEEGARFRFDYKRWERIKVPVPPKEVQKEIIKILNMFREYLDILELELIMRKTQYEHYRKYLFSNVHNLERFSLGEIASIKTGNKPKKILDAPYKYEYINAGTTKSGYTSIANCVGDTVTTPSRGQGGIGFVGYQYGSFWLGPLCYRIQSYNKYKVLNRYLFYYLNCFNEKILCLKKEGGTPSVNASDLAQIVVEVPPIEEQKCIITILDKFDSLCNDMERGLPAEIEARRKQYEYYRDKLLTFKELS